MALMSRDEYKTHFLKKDDVPFPRPIEDHVQAHADVEGLKTASDLLCAEKEDFARQLVVACKERDKLQASKGAMEEQFFWYRRFRAKRDHILYPIFCEVLADLNVQNKGIDLMEATVRFGANVASYVTSMTCHHRDFIVPSMHYLTSLDDE